MPAQRFRAIAAFQSDRNTLVKEALGFKTPGLPPFAFNSLKMPSEQSQYEGLKQIFKELFSVYRNPTAHEPKAPSKTEERDATIVLLLAPSLHRRLDLPAHAHP